MVTLLAIGITQAFLLAAALWFQPRGPRLANRWLALLLGAIGIGLLSHWLYLSGYWIVVPKLLVIASTVVFLFGPLLLMYVRQATAPHLALSPASALHLLPWAANLMFLGPVLVRPDTELVALIDESMRSYQRGEVGIGAVNIARCLSLAAYTAFAVHRLRCWRRVLHDQVANDERVSLSWLSFVLMLFAAVATLVLAMVAAGPRAPIPVDSAISIAMVAFALAVGVAGLRQPALFSTSRSREDDKSGDALSGRTGAVQAAAAAVDAKIPIMESPRPRNVSADQAAALREKLEQEMKVGHLYRDHELSLARLARAVGATPHQVSEVLNTTLGCTFYEFVNLHRIEAVKRDLLEGSRPMLDLALEAGFSNKSTFNKVFKDHTGQTPSAFRRAGNAS